MKPSIIHLLKENKIIQTLDDDFQFFNEFHMILNEDFKNNNYFKTGLNYIDYLIKDKLPFLFKKYNELHIYSSLFKKKYSNNEKENIIITIFMNDKIKKLDRFENILFENDLEKRINLKLILSDEEKANEFKICMERLHAFKNQKNKYTFIISKIKERFEHGKFNKKIFDYLIYKDNLWKDDSKVDIGSYFDNESFLFHENKIIKDQNNNFLKSQNKYFFQKISNPKIKEKYFEQLKQVNNKYKLLIEEKNTNDKDSIILSFKLNSEIENNEINLRINFTLDEEYIILHDSNNFKLLNEEIEKIKKNINDKNKLKLIDYINIWINMMNI